MKTKTMAHVPHQTQAPQPPYRIVDQLKIDEIAERARLIQGLRATPATIEPKYFYEVTFDKPGGLVMPLIVELTYEDGTTETQNFPAQIWRMNDKEVIRTFATQKSITKIQLDPKLETADIDVTNNSWPKEEVKSKFD